MVRHRDLGDGEPLHLDERRQEPVHPVEELQVLDALASERAIGAAGVTDRVVRQLVPHPVRDARRRDADRAVSLISRRGPRAADTVEPLEGFEEPGEIARVVLQVGVEGDQVRAAGGLQSLPARRRLAGVGGEPLHADPRIVRREFLEDGPRRVRAAIVCDDDLVGHLQRLRALANGGDQRAYVPLLVVS